MFAALPPRFALWYNDGVGSTQENRLGPYRIFRTLGRGGMGVVYEVEHVELGVRRALKVFTRVDDGELRRRFLAEGRLLA